jgi:hypothetical protein
MTSKAADRLLHIGNPKFAPLHLESSPTNASQTTAATSTVAQKTQTPSQLDFSKITVKAEGISAAIARQGTQSPLSALLAKRGEGSPAPIPGHRNQSPISPSLAKRDVKPLDSIPTTVSASDQETESPRSLVSSIDVKGAMPIPAKRMQAQPYPAQKEDRGKDRNGSKAFAPVGRYAPEKSGAGHFLESPPKDKQKDKEGFHRSDSSSSQLLAVDSPPLGPKALTASDSLDHLFPLDEEVNEREKFFGEAERTKAQRVYKHCMIRIAPSMKDPLSRSYP